MYMLKAQKRLMSIERQEEEERRMEQARDRLGTLKIVRGAVSNDIQEDGPPGAKKKVKYVGSFKVYPPPGLTGRELQNAVSGFVWERITTINPKRVGNPISGTMIINRHGIKIFKDKELFMAYPLKKVSYCTAVPKNCLFAMVTRSILDQPPDVLYCHTFGLSSAEHANEASQLMSEAFKIALAHRTLRRSLEMESGKKVKGKKKDAKSPWDMLKRKKKSPATSPKPSPRVSPTPPRPNSEHNSIPSVHSDTSPSAPPLPSRPNNLSTPAIVEFAPSPTSHHRSGSISSSGVTSVGLEAEIVLIEQRIANLETRLVALPENDETAFDLTIELSALEDQLNVKRQQLDTLVIMERSNLTSPTAAVAETPPPSYYDLPPVNSSSIQPPIDQLLPPSYNELGATGGNERYSAAFEGEELVLQDAAWYRAGLPRQLVMDILSQQPPGSFIVRDSSTNPGCHAISVVAPDSQILHYLIVRGPEGYYIQGSNRYHTDLLSLILYHAEVVDFLPTTLFLGATNPLAPLPPPPGINEDWVYAPDDSDEEIDDSEMQSHLANLQFINP